MNGAGGHTAEVIERSGAAAPAGHMNSAGRPHERSSSAAMATTRASQLAKGLHQRNNDRISFVSRSRDSRIDSDVAYMAANSAPGACHHGIH